MTDHDKEILSWLLQRVPLPIFNAAVTGYNLQRIYENRMTRLKYEFFDGNELRASIEMRRIFDQFQTQAQEAEAREIAQQAKQMQRKILSRYCANRSDLTVKYNAAVDRLNELNAGVNTLRQVYRKAREEQPQ